MARLSWDEFNATLARVMRECLADGVFPSIREVGTRGITCDSGKVGRTIRMLIESGEVEIPESFPGLKAARGQWIRAGKRPAQFREPREPRRLSEAQLQREAAADARIPASVVAARAAEIKAENLRAGKVDSCRPLLRVAAARAAMTLSERALSDYRGAMRRINGSTGRVDRPGQEPR